jgi:hypothetical protein
MTAFYVSGGRQRVVDGVTFVAVDIMFSSCSCSPLKMPPQTDHLAALMVPAGADSYKQIGRAKVAMPGQLTAADVVATLKVRGRSQWQGGAELQIAGVTMKSSCSHEQ